MVNFSEHRDGRHILHGPELHSGSSFACWRRDELPVIVAVQKMNLEHGTEQFKKASYEAGRAVAENRGQHEVDDLKKEIQRLRTKLACLSTQVEQIRVAFGTN